MFDQMDRIVRQANPVLDVIALDSISSPVLLLDEQGRMEMQTQEKVNVDPGPPRRRWGWALAIPAVVAIIVVGILLMATRGSNEILVPADDPVTTTQVALVDPVPAPESVATAFLEARTAGDHASAAGYLSDDATIEMGPADSPETMSLEMAWQEAAGLILTVDRCTAGAEASVDGGTAVSCSVLLGGAVARANGIAPYSGSYDFVVLDGMITSVILTDIGSYSAYEWEPFGRWVALKHFEDVLSMYEDRAQTTILLTPPSIDLWSEYTDEYVSGAAEQLAFDFLEARAVWDSDEAVSYLDENPIVAVSPADSADTLALEMAWQEATGLVITPSACTTGPGQLRGEPISITCVVVINGSVATASGVEPYPGGYEFEVSDGIIRSVTFNDLGLYSSSEWVPFKTWVAANHPDDIVVMYTGGRHDTPQLDQESFDLWRTYTAEYVAERASG